jgi:hypothetical protein
MTPLRGSSANDPGRGGRGLTHRHPPPPHEGPASPSGPFVVKRAGRGPRRVAGNGWSPVNPASGNGWENQALFGFDDRLLPAARELWE